MPRLARLLVLCTGVASLALAGCGPKAPAPLQCGVTQLFCSGKCVDFLTDPANCGGCGVSCPTPTGGSPACSNGLCGGSCPAPSQICSVRPDAGSLAALCTDVTKDPLNCGGCGIVCTANQSCTNSVCTALPPGFTTCGAPDGGTAAPAIDLQSDRSNCGACSNSCIASEICRAGDCVPCPGFQLNNRCVDVTSDSQNCGTAGTACTGTNVCVQGKCAPGVAAAFQQPAAAGKIAVNGSTITVRVDSALPIRAVQLAGSNGLADGGTSLLSMNLQSAADLSPTIWTLLPSYETLLIDGGITVSNAPPADGGYHVLATAFDIAWRADAGDATQHSATATTDLAVLQPPDAGGEPQGLTFDLGAGGTLRGQDIFIPMNAGPITLRTTVPATSTATAVQFVSAAPGVLLGTVPLDGGTASLTVLPGDLTAQGNINAIVVCAIDVAGQGDFLSPSSSCVADAGFGTIPTISIFGIGQVPRFGASEPLMTAAPDGGGPTIVWLGDAGQVIPISGTQILTTDAGTALPIVSPFDGGGYFMDSLVPTETSVALLATRSDGTAIDRFDCAAGTCNRTQGYVTGSTLSKVLATTGKAVLSTSAGKYAYAFPPGAPSATVVGNSAVNVQSGINFGTTSSGAIVFVAADLGGSNQVYLVHPGFGLRSLGETFTGTIFDLFVAPTGEIVWQYSDPAGTGAKFYLAGAFFDGNNAPVITPKQQVNDGGAFGWQVVRPQILIGIGNDIGKPTAVPVVPPNLRVFVANLNKKNFAAPTGLFTNLGTPFLGIRSRLDQRVFWGVSDDELKLLHLTKDPSPNDPGGVTYTLWLTDLVNADIQAGTTALYTSPFLSGFSGAAQPDDFAAHFVHSASGVINTVGGPPASAVALPGAVIFGEDLRPVGIGTGPQAARVFYALYKADTSAPAPVQVDRLALSVRNPVSGLFTQNFYNADSAAGAQLLFIGYQDQNLYTVPLAAVASGTATSTFLADAPLMFLTREDKARLLVQRSDGVLLSGKLEVGKTPTLTAVLEGLLSGPQRFDQSRSAPQFGFTPDGDHAYAFLQLGGDVQQNTGQAALGQIETVDLTTTGGARVNFGRAMFSIKEPQLRPQACFLSNGSIALTIAPASANYQRYGSLVMGNAATAPAQTDLGSGPVNDLGNPELCETSLDATEALAAAQIFPEGADIQEAISTTGAYQSPFTLSPVSSGGNPTVLLNRIAALAGPATYSPFGGPYLDEFDLLSVLRNGASATVYKVWGESAGNGKGFPFIPVTTGFVPTLGTLPASSTPASAVAIGTLGSTRFTDNFGALLVTFHAPNSLTNSFVMELPLAGKAPPPRPLP